MSDPAHSAPAMPAQALDPAMQVPVMIPPDADEPIIFPGPGVPLQSYVYEGPVRLWHWTMAFAIFALIPTGYLIGAPPTSIGGEAYQAYLFGWIRMIHFGAGYVLAIGLVARAYWALVGNRHAKQIFYAPLWKKEFRKSLWEEILWYSFFKKEPNRYMGHNPLAAIAMLCFFAGAVFMSVTGLALYAEGAQAGSWAHNLFGWVIGWFGNTMALHTAHHLGMWGIIVFIMIHLYALFREDVLEEKTVVSTMVSGWRIFRTHGPGK